MKIDVHMHMTQPLELVTDQLKKGGFDRGIICSSAVARGECIDTLADAREMMGRVAEVQNRPVEKTVSQINREIAAAVRQYPDLLWGFGKADLFQPDPEAAVREIAELGLQGVGEIVGLHGNVPKLEPILAAAEAADLPVFLHTDYPVDGADLAAVAELINAHPRAQVILGHMGGDFWMDAVAMAAEHANLWLDTSEVVNQVALQVAVNTVPDRVLFSTDYPWDAPESMEARIAALRNSEETKQAVLGGSALKLFERWTRKGGAQ